MVKTFYVLLLYICFTLKNYLFGCFNLMYRLTIDMNITELDKLDSLLSKQSYIEGFIPTKADIK